MDPELPCAFNSHYNIRDSIVEYEIDLRNELHEETPEPWLFLEDLAGGVSECEVNIPGSASDDFAEAAEDSGPADVAGDVEGSAFSNAAEGAVGAGGLDLAGTKAHLKGAARTLRPRSSLGKLAQGSKPVLGNKVINAPSVKWRLAAALAAQSSSSSNTGDIPDLQDQPQEQQIGCKRKRPRKRKKAKKPSGTFESDAMPPPQQEPLSTDVPMALPFPSSSPPNFPVPAPYNANRVADVKTKHTHRGGKRLKEAKMYTDDPRGQRLFRLRLRVLQRGELHRSDTFSMLHHASYSSTGWSGRRYNPAWRAEVRKAVADPGSDMWNKYLPEFLQLPFAKDSTFPLILLDCEDRMAVVRTVPCPYLNSDERDELAAAFQKLLQPTLRSPAARFKCSLEERGDHFGGIMGEHREYGEVPKITEWHKDHQPECEELFQLAVFQKFIGWLSSCVELYFPKVADRYKTCIAWNEKRHKIKARFGLFFQLCINGYFPGQKRVHCKPHSDSKNIIGVCIVVAYVLPGYNFDHTKYSWLVIWELGVIIELPPWAALLYPSCLFFHFNVDIDQIRVVQTTGRIQPTRENSIDITNMEDRSSGRGSMVLFNQASMFQSSETDSDSLKAAEKEGKTITVEYAPLANHLYGTKTAT